MYNVVNNQKFWAFVHTPVPLDKDSFHGYCNQSGSQQCWYRGTGGTRHDQDHGRGTTIPRQSNVQCTAQFSEKQLALFSEVGRAEPLTRGGQVRCWGGYSSSDIVSSSITVAQEVWRPFTAKGQVIELDEEGNTLTWMVASFPIFITIWEMFRHGSGSLSIDLPAPAEYRWQWNVDRRWFLLSPRGKALNRFHLLFWVQYLHKSRRDCSDGTSFIKLYAQLICKRSVGNAPGLQKVSVPDAWCVFLKLVSGCEAYQGWSYDRRDCNALKFSLDRSPNCRLCQFRVSLAESKGYECSSWFAVSPDGLDCAWPHVLLHFSSEPCTTF